jgi:hypothetical protein
MRELTDLISGFIGKGRVAHPSIEAAMAIIINETIGERILSAPPVSSLDGGRCKALKQAFIHKE